MRSNLDDGDAMFSELTEIHCHRCRRWFAGPCRLQENTGIVPASFAVVGIQPFGLSQDLLHFVTRLSLQSLELPLAPYPIFHAVARRTLAAGRKGKKQE